MNDISSILGETYGTKTSSDEDREKVAQVQFFNDLCKENGIDVNELEDSQISDLWKTAMEHMPGSAGSEETTDAGGQEQEKEAAARVEYEKKTAAQREWQEKRAAAEKLAESDALGRVMAHAYVDELKKIAEGNGNMPPQFMKKDEEGDDKGKEDKKDKKEEKDDEEKEASASQKKADELIARMQKGASAEPSTTSNLDEQAAYHAIDMLKQAEVDPNTAFSRINAVFTLGLPESTKLASTQSFEQGLHVRALEFCEAAGFRVDWDQA